MSDSRTPDAKLIEAGIILARTYTRDELAQSMLTRLATRLKELVEERRWVPVGERLPGVGVSVLAIDDDGIAVHWWEGHRWCSEKFCYTCPTHWMPLPSGPETKESSDV